MLTAEPGELGQSILTSGKHQWRGEDIELPHHHTCHNTTVELSTAPALARYCRVDNIKQDNPNSKILVILLLQRIFC